MGEKSFHLVCTPCWNSREKNFKRRFRSPEFKATSRPLSLSRSPSTLPADFMRRTDLRASLSLCLNLRDRTVYSCMGGNANKLSEEVPAGVVSCTTESSGASGRRGATTQSKQPRLDLELPNTQTPTNYPKQCSGRLRGEGRLLRSGSVLAQNGNKACDECLPSPGVAVHTILLFHLQA